MCLCCRRSGRCGEPLLLTSLWFIGLSPLLFSALAVLVPLDLHRLGWGAAAVGTVFFVSAIFEAFVHPLLGRWSDRSGYRPPVFVGLLASIGILLLLTWVGNPWVIGLLVVLAAGAFNATLVPGTALFSRGTEKAGMDRAVAFAITNFAWASGYAVGAPVGRLPRGPQGRRPLLPRAYGGLPVDDRPRPPYGLR